MSRESTPSLSSKTVVCDIYGTLMRSCHYFFPYFVLVAFEARGGIFRTLLLLIAYPLILLLPLEMKLRVMIFITFSGLSLKDMDWIQRTVLPKFYIEDLNYHVYELFVSANKRLVFTTMPRVMVEGFVKDYLNVDHVFGTELHHVGPYFTGLLTNSGLLLKHDALKSHFGAEKPDDIVAFASSGYHDPRFLSYFDKDLLWLEQNECEDTSDCRNMSRSQLRPKPVVFHDGKLAFFPTPSTTLCMFMWLPMGIILTIIRAILAIFIPFKLSLVMCGFIGMRLRLSNNFVTRKRSKVLFVSNHRTLLDPLYLSACVGKSLTVVTYSLSRISEKISVVGTERLTRDRKQDKETIRRLLTEDNVAIFPEGTTCREPYLLRFSPLFAEMTDEIVPVAMDTRVSMFYANTTNGFKATDPIYFLLNPEPTYLISILEKLPKELTCGAGGKSSVDVANYMQKRIGQLLGFQCTSLTRRDKYLLLAGNSGFVKPSTE